MMVLEYQLKYLIYSDITFGEERADENLVERGICTEREGLV